MKAAGKILRFYRGLITQCIPLFVAAGLAAMLCNGSDIPNVLYDQVIPVLMGYQSGKRCGGDAGGFAGALAASAVVLTGSGFGMAASVLGGSAAGFVYRAGMDKLRDRIPVGFEMLTGNLYLAASGLLAGFLTFRLFLPAVLWADGVCGAGIAAVTRTGLLPLSGLAVEPLKVLFFNNWLNHGVLVPLGIEQVKSSGSSILFLLESNPGPGAGILAAFALLGREKRRETASSLVIQALGGIHEIYFPYVLSDLRFLAAAAAGGIAGNYCFQVFDCGLSGSVSPGSVITILMMADAGKWPGLMAGILASAAVSCALSCLILYERQRGRRVKKPGEVQTPEPDIGSREEKKDMKLYFVCDAGMGSSAMACALFKRKLKAEGLDGAQVFHTSADRIPGEADALVCQSDFASALPVSGILCFQVADLLDMDSYGEVLEWLKGKGGG